MRSIILAVLAYFVSISSFAQWRLDADVRLGRANIDYEEPWDYNSGYGFSYNYFDAFSWGADVNIGREFSHGWAVYSGLMYDMMRFSGSDKTTYNHGQTIRFDSGMHVFSFVTVPVKVEYRCVRDIIRPHIGFGAGLQVKEHENITEKEHGRRVYRYQHEFFVPTAMFGLNLEYRRFIVGFARRIDLKEFWWDATTRDTWRLAQTTVKIGYRIF